jgi:hypothetical protein
MPTFTEMQERLAAESRWDFSDMSAVYINCTLKRSPESSHTQGLADRSIAIMERNGVAVERFHDASTTSFGTWTSASAVSAAPLPKRTREDGRCPARTGDLLLVRREHVLPSTAVCRSGRSPSDSPRIPAALCCGLPLPERFH